MRADSPEFIAKRWGLGSSLRGDMAVGLLDFKINRGKMCERFGQLVKGYDQKRLREADNFKLVHFSI